MDKRLVNRVFFHSILDTTLIHYSHKYIITLIHYHTDTLLTLLPRGKKVAA